MSLLPLTLGTLVDVIAVMVCLFFLGRGLIRGASEEIARLTGFAAGAWAGYALYPAIQRALLAGDGPVPSVALALTALALTILSGFIIAMTVRFLFNAMLHVAILQPADAVVGLVSGAVYAAAVLAVLFAVGMLLPVRSIQQAFTEQSRVGQHVCPWLSDHMGLS